jgi:hypothetical protein
MFTSLDLLYIVLAFCTVAITIVAVLIGSEVLRVAKDARQISHQVTEISQLVRHIAMIVFPGVQKMSNAARRTEENVSDILDTANSFMESIHRRPRKK